MTERRSVRCILMSAAVLLAGASCDREPAGDADGGVGGSATGGATPMGGSATAGSATGGATAMGGGGTAGDAAGGTASVCIGTTVASLPTMNTACTTAGESQCDATGNRCVCERGRWYCTTICASSYPTEPTPDSECTPGAACNYPTGTSCMCINSRWWCIGTSDCPAAANMPLTGQACNGLQGRQCDYPNQNPAYHMLCACYSNSDPSTGSTWTCWQSGRCPTTEPSYGEACSMSFTTCSYGSNHCNCMQANSPWVCGLGILLLPFDDTTLENCGATGRSCSTQNVMTRSCQGGVCTSTCLLGWLNVSQPATGPDDGCETVDLDTNPGNCGATGRSCSTQNITAVSCRGGVCKPTCQLGWLDVSQPASGPDDGCETIDTAVNVDHCGALGRACSSAHVATRQCAAGLCTSSCQPGYGNVNRPAAPAADDGCDKPVTTVTFSGLAVGETLSSYTEAGFTVVGDTDNWRGYSYGNPGPARSIVIETAGGPPVVGQITVTADGSPFYFVSAGTYSSVIPIPWVFTGLMGGTTVFSVSGTAPNNFGGGATVENPRVGDLIDTLSIELTNSVSISNPMALGYLTFAR